MDEGGAPVFLDDDSGDVGEEDPDSILYLLRYVPLGLVVVSPYNLLSIYASSSGNRAIILLCVDATDIRISWDRAKSKLVSGLVDDVAAFIT